MPSVMHLLWLNAAIYFTIWPIQMIDKGVWVLSSQRNSGVTVGLECKYSVRVFKEMLKGNLQKLG